MRARQQGPRVPLILGFALALACVALASGSAPSAAASGRWHWPLDPLPRVVRGFEPPSSPYGPGHRGVDLAGVVGQQVLAIGTGVVTFAGVIAGRGVVVVDHGALSSTYQPVSAAVSPGQPVAAGQPVGFLQAVLSHCLPDACLHLGVRRGETYLDPLTLLPARPVRLEPPGGLTGRGSLAGRSSTRPGALPGRETLVGPAPGRMGLGAIVGVEAGHALG